MPLIIATLFVVGLQLAVFTTLRVEGAVIMLVWLWPLAMGLAGYTGLALVAAVVAGVFFDTHATTPFGLSVLVALSLAYGASRLGREGVGDLDSAAWWVTPLLGALAGFIAPALFVASACSPSTSACGAAAWSRPWWSTPSRSSSSARPLTRVARGVGRIRERARR